MAEIKKLLEVRDTRNKKKPVFARRDARKKAKVSWSWRKPRGKHSPSRQKHRGKQQLVTIGYGSPKEVKHLHSSGLEKIIVKNKKDISGINPEKQGIVVSSLVGNKKRIELIKLALEKKIPILNLTDSKKFLKDLEQSFKVRQDLKKKKTAVKEQKESEKKKKAEEKEKQEKEEEEKKKAEKEAKSQENQSSSEEGKKKEPKPELTPEEKEKREAEKNIIKKQ